MVMTTAFIVGIMLSPRSFTLSGNLAGCLGNTFLGLIPLALFGHFLTVHIYRTAYGSSARGRTEMDDVIDAFGKVLALSLALGPRILFTITASISILAIAGYVFNEVFVYWFPNLGFSFLLLAGVFVFNGLGMRVAGKVQAFLVAVSVLGLVALVVSGVVTEADPLSESHPDLLPGRDLLFAGAASFLLFVGFDLSESFHRFRRREAGSLLSSMVGSLLIVAALFFSWGWVSMKFVPLDRLSETTVPAMVAAKAILGQSGRILMGIILLAASAGSVNGLLIGTSSLICRMADRGLLPSLFKRSFAGTNLSFILLVLGVASLLYLGMAGKPILEVFIRGGLSLWLLYYAALHLAVLLKRKFNPSGQSARRSGMLFVVPILGCIIFLAAFFVHVVYVCFI